jgi:hypothetical protein
MKGKSRGHKEKKKPKGYLVEQRKRNKLRRRKMIVWMVGGDPGTVK